MAVILDGSTMVNNTGHVPLIITEPDGSQWMQIFHHNNPANSYFTTTDTFALGCYISEDLWFNVGACNKFTKWEMLVKQSRMTTTTYQKFRWIQNYNPMTATYAQVSAANVTFVTGGTYSSPNSGYGGFYRQTNGSCYINACNGQAEANWYCALGAWNAYQDGIPGYNATAITTGYLDVYIRIDNDSISGTDLWDLKKTYRTFNNFADKYYNYKKFSAFTIDSSTTSKAETLTATTQGRPVMITISGDLNSSTSGSWSRVRIYRDGTQLRNVIVLTPGSSQNIGFCASYLDTVPAGTYAYKAEFTLGGGSCTFGESGDNDAPVFSVFEIV